MFGFTVTVNAVVAAHNPAVGVNVYTPETSLLTTAEGLHVPAIPSVEVTGNAGTVPPSHILNVVPKTNVGVTFGVTVTVNVTVAST